MLTPGIIASAGTDTPSCVLDPWPTSHAAYSLSLRLLSSYTGPIIRIIRDSDSAEMDAAYGADNSVDQTNGTLLSFVSGTTARLHTRYDQSGNGRHQTVNTNLTRARVYFSGAFATDPNGHLATQGETFIGNGYATATEFAAYTGTTLTVIQTARTSTDSNSGERWAGAVSGSSPSYDSTARMDVILRKDTDLTLTGYRNNIYQLASPIAFAEASWFVAGARLTGSNYVLRVGASASASGASSGSFSITRWLDGGYQYGQADAANGHFGSSAMGEQIWFTGDIGSTDTDAIMAALRTYRGAA